MFGRYLEQRDLDADVVEHRRELMDADGTGADDDDVLRERVQPETWSLVTIHFAVDLEDRADDLTREPVASVTRPSR